MQTTMDAVKTQDVRETSPHEATEAERLDYIAYAPAVPAENTAVKKKTAYLFVKRLMDVVLSFCALAALSPVFLAVAIAIRLDSKGPVFFVHRRIGQNGSELKLYKFRSMVTNAEELMARFTPEQKRKFAENFKLDHDPRITKIGSFLRRTSLDELPQLLNILQGNLSIVGPRPLVRDEILKYGSNQQKFMSAKPGLTGYWQVNGRSATTYEERMALELYYVDHASLWLDLKIICKTVFVVLKRDGAM